MNHRTIISLLVCFLTVVLPAAAQRQKQYIYLFDCTQSMQQLGLWQPTRAALDRIIERERVNDDTEFVVIPFQDRAYTPITFSSATYPGAKADIDKAFDTYIEKRTNTNILDVFNTGLRHIDPRKDNYLCLLTDGEDNVHGMDKVCEALRKWCASHTNTRFFYVILSDKAANRQLADAIAACDDAYIVEPGQLPFGSVLSPVVRCNTLELDRDYTIGFSESGSYPVTVSCSDPYFDVQAADGRIDSRKLRLRITPRDARDIVALNAALDAVTGSDGVYEFGIDVRVPDGSMNVVNPHLTVEMTNKPLKSLSLNSNSLDEIAAPGADYHPAFLFCSESAPDTMVIDLSPAFNDAACKAGSAATLQISAADGQPRDYTAACDGSPIGDDGKFTLRPGAAGRLTLVFAPDALTGKRYFDINVASTHRLETVNDMAATDSVTLPVRTSYSTHMNPLALGLMWAAIILAAALILWFAILRRMVYPTMKLSMLQLSGPAPYMAQKKIKGSVKVVLTSRKIRQSALSRLFKGRVTAIVSPVWADPIEIVPRRRGAVMRTHNRWNVSPTTTLRPGDYTLINIATKAKTTLKVM